MGILNEMEMLDWKAFPTTAITASSWDELDEAENVSDKNQIKSMWLNHSARRMK